MRIRGLWPASAPPAERDSVLAPAESRVTLAISGPATSADGRLPEDGLLAGRRGGEADAEHRAAGRGEGGDRLDARAGQALPGRRDRLPPRSVRRGPHQIGRTS